MSQLLRVQNFVVSSDGFGTGDGQSLERLFGHANPAEFVSWAGATASWVNCTDPGGSRGLDDHFTRDRPSRCRTPQTRSKRGALKSFSSANEEVTS